MTKLKIFSVFTILIVFLAFKNSEKILETFYTTYDPAKQDKAAPILFDENQQLEDLKYLSSDDFMGRATGHKGGLKARDFIVEKFPEELSGKKIEDNKDDPSKRRKNDRLTRRKARLERKIKRQENKDKKTYAKKKGKIKRGK